MKAAIVSLVLLAGAGVAADDLLTMQDPVFNSGSRAAGTPSTWTFRTSTENAVARVLVDSEGAREGAAPDGYAEVAVRAQDEIHDGGRVASSSDVRGYMRVMSRSYGAAGDRTIGQCRGSQCPETLEIVSTKHLRLTPSDHGRFDVVVGTRILPDGAAAVADRLVITDDGAVRFPDLTAKPRRMNYACLDDSGRLVGRPRPCDR